MTNHKKDKKELEESSSVEQKPEDVLKKAERSPDPQDLDTDSSITANLPKAELGWRSVLLAHRKLSVIAAFAIVLTVLMLIPLTRYIIAGTVLRQTFRVAVVDAETGKPVSSAKIRLTGKEAITDNEGHAEIRANVGYAKLEVSKSYYKSIAHDVLVPIRKPQGSFEVRLKATGRSVPLTVTNKITKQPLANIAIKALSGDSEAKTDSKGKAILVVPADQKDIKISLTGKHFNDTEVTLKVTTEEGVDNHFSLTPSGKIYFLSNASGKLDLVKSNLDGTGRQTVLAGTGKEDRHRTLLLASRDWKYISLLSRRDGGDYSKLFLIETKNDKVSTFDEGEAEFTPYGWSGDRFVYKVNRDRNYWQPKRQALKSYDAASKKLTTLVETAAEGNKNNFAYEYFGQAYIIGKEIVFFKNWDGECGSYYVVCHGPSRLIGKKATVNSVHADGSNKKVIKTYNDQRVAARSGDFGEIYILYESSKTSKVEEYHDGKITSSDQSPDQFYSEQYPRYSVSPSASKTLWSREIDGKNTFFVGDASGDNGKTIGRSEDFSVYGWFTDNYVLLTKKGGEMHILPAEGLSSGLEGSLKITDYYTPDYIASSFGYGYGG